MNSKQKLSLFSAMLLPALALSVYFLCVPARANATSCPGGKFRSACGPGGSGCQSGGGFCYPNGSEGHYVYCPPIGGPGGLGICEDGYTCCIQ